MYNIKKKIITIGTHLMEIYEEYLLVVQLSIIIVSLFSKLITLIRVKPTLVQSSRRTGNGGDKKIKFRKRSISWLSNVIQSHDLSCMNISLSCLILQPLISLDQLFYIFSQNFTNR